MDCTPGSCELRLNAVSRLSRLAAMLLVAAACVPGASGGSSAPSMSPSPAYRGVAPQQLGGTLVMADYEFPAGFNVLAPATEAELRAGGLLFSRLWGLDGRLNPYPDLVREVPTLENGLVKVAAGGREMTVDIKLVAGLRWSDGAPLNVDDVDFTWRSTCDGGLPTAPGGLGRIDSMERRSDTELIWHLRSITQPVCGATPTSKGVYGGYLLLGASMAIMPMHRLQSLPAAGWRAYFARPDVVSGPFSLGEIAPGSRLVFPANPWYAAGRSAPAAYRGGGGPFDHGARLNGVVLRVYPSKDAMLAGLRGGEADLGFHLGADDLAALGSMARSAPVAGPGLRDELLTPNHATNTATRADPPWVQAGGAEDRPLLQALSMAIDRQALARQGIGADVAVTASRGLFPSALGAYADAGLPAQSADMAGARRLLEEDGWRAAGTDAIRSRNGRKLDFELLAACGAAASERELEYLKEAWALVGASVRAGCRPRAQLFGSYATGGTAATGGFDMLLWSNSWPADPDGWAATASSSGVPGPGSPDGRNWGRCHDPELEADFATGAGTISATARRAAYLKGQREWLAYHCTVPLFEWPQVRQVSGQVRNFTATPLPGQDTWNAADWWLRS